MASTRGAPEAHAGVPTKTLSLMLLALQNSTLILVMHYSRIMPLVGGRKYLPSTAVLASEVIKFTISLTMALYELQTKLHNAPATTLFSDLLRSLFSGDSWKMAIPALLYSLQNSLQYIAASNLDASTLQITYQLKILTTALFSVLLLRRKLTGRKWLSLFMLAVGVTLVQVPLSAFTSDSTTLQAHDSSASSWISASFNRVLGVDTGKALTKRSATYQGIDEDYKLYNPHLNGTIGLLAVLVACATSGLAGVYFEMVLKDGSSLSSSQAQSGSRSSPTGVWIRNTQLSFYSLFPALFIGVIFNDGEEIAKHGFLAGYNWVVITVVLLQAFGGILVSLVIKYADNIAKNFATSIGIIISFVISFLFLDLEPSLHYIIGAAIVIGATWLYNSQSSSPIPRLVVNDDTDYEKQQQGSPERGYYDDSDDTRASRSKMKKEFGLSTSRTSTPLGVRPSSQRRQYYDKRDV